MGRGGSTHNNVVTVEVHELVVNASKLACFKHSDSVDLVSSYNFWDNLEVGPVQVREQVTRAFQDEQFAMKTPNALVILVCLVDVRVTLLFIANAACSRNCAATPVIVLAVLDFELIVNVSD